MIKIGRLATFNFFLTISITLISVIFIGAFWINDKYISYENDIKQLRSQYIQKQKELLRKEVQSAVKLSVYENKQIEKELKNKLKKRVYEAHQIATKIYNKFKDTKNKEEIISILNEALLGIKISNKTVDILKDKEESFFEYNLFKQNNIRFVKLFKPYNIILEISESLITFEDSIKQQILKKLSLVRFGQDGYLFVYDYTGKCIMHPIKPSLVGRNMINLKDKNNVFIIKELISKAKNENGGFVKYIWHKPSINKDTDKLGFALSISQWNWIVGSGIYIDDIDLIVSKKEKKLQEEITQSIYKIIALLLFLIFFISLLIRWLNKKTTNSFDQIMIYLKKASTQNIYIYKEKIEFFEFRELADVINSMIKSRNKIQKELESQKYKAEEATNAKSEFLANMSHEIRTPMNGIIGMSHLALQTNLTNEQKPYIENINNSANSLLNIINDILDFSKIEAGKLTVDEIDFNMIELLREIESTITTRIENKNLLFSIEHQCSHDNICYGDSLRIRQILINLIGNAIKFTTKGFVKVSVVRKNNNLVRFEIEDSGIGISKEQQEKLFQSFSQADGSTTRKYGGTGLGLSISKQLVELMDGKIWVESEVEVGSKFIFELRLNEGNKNNIEKVKVIDFKQINTLRNSNILLVEDNIINQDIIIGLLKQSGINIDIASNGKEAIDLFKKNKYELILMDLQMPIMDGYEATKIIRQNDKDIPIIALTANAMKEDIEATRLAGMQVHLNKPIDISKLYFTLLKYISKKVDNSTNIIEKDEVTVPNFINIDSSLGLSHMANNKKLYLKIVNDFYKNYKDLELDTLQDDELKRVIHTIKGLSANIGAIRLSKISKELEDKFDKILFEKFEEELINILKELKDLKSEDLNQKNLLELTIIEKDKLFDSLKEFVKKRRVRGCKDILKKLDTYKILDSDKIILDKVKDYLEKREYSKILDILNDK